MKETSDGIAPNSVRMGSNYSKSGESSQIRRTLEPVKGYNVSPHFKVHQTANWGVPKIAIKEKSALDANAEPSQYPTAALLEGVETGWEAPKADT